jgi:hypothetical protein
MVEGHRDSPFLPRCSVCAVRYPTEECSSVLPVFNLDCDSSVSSTIWGEPASRGRVMFRFLSCVDTGGICWHIVRCLWACRLLLIPPRSVTVPICCVVCLCPPTGECLALIRRWSRLLYVPARRCGFCLWPDGLCTFDALILRPVGVVFVRDRLCGFCDSPAPMLSAS